MTEIRGTIIDITDGTAYVMTQACDIVRTPATAAMLPGMPVRLMQRKTVHQPAGRSLTHPENASRAIPHSRNRAAKQLLAACLVLFMVLVPVLGLINPVFAWVSLDINPSIEFAVNPALTVIRANGLNADARQLMLDGEYIGLPLDQSVRIFLEQAAKAGYQVGDAEHPLIIDAALMKLQTRIGTGGKYESSAALTAMLQHMKSQFGQDGINAVVRMEPSAVRNEARKLGLSIGRYALMEMAKESGAELSPEESRTMQLSRLMSLAGKKLTETSLTVGDEGASKEPDASLFDNTAVQPADTMKNSIEAKPGETTSAGGISSNGTQEKERNANQERNALQEQNVGTSNELAPVQNKEQTQLTEQQRNADQSAQSNTGSAISGTDTEGSATTQRASSSETTQGSNDSHDATVPAPENGNSSGGTQEPDNSSSPAEQPSVGNSVPSPTAQPSAGNSGPSPTAQPSAGSSGPSPTAQPSAGNSGPSPTPPATEPSTGPSDTGNCTVQGDGTTSPPVASTGGN